MICRNFLHALYGAGPQIRFTIRDDQLVSLDRNSVIPDLDFDAASALLVIHVANDEDAHCKQSYNKIKCITIHLNTLFAC